MSCNHCPIASDSAELFWTAAINDWHETGNTATLEKGLADGIPTPPFARAFLADLIGNRVKRNPELPKSERLRRDLFIRGNYRLFLRHAQILKRKGKLLYGEKPSDVAIRELAEFYSLSEETVRSILHRKRV